MSKYRTPPDSAELREAEDGFRRWLLPEGCSDLIDVESPAASEPPQCTYCGATSVLHDESITLPAGYLMFPAICEACAPLWRLVWAELEAKGETCLQDGSKSSAEISDAYNALAERIRRRVRELIAERKKKQN